MYIQKRTHTLKIGTHADQVARYTTSYDACAPLIPKFRVWQVYQQRHLRS